MERKEEEKKDEDLRKEEKEEDETGIRNTYSREFDGLARVSHRRSCVYILQPRLPCLMSSLRARHTHSHSLNSFLQ